MHLALGRGDLTSLKVGDDAACERQAQRALGTFIAADPGHNPPTDPYPEPVGHCVICRWDDLSTARRRRDDDLSLVAGITKDQRRALKTAGVPARRGLASLAVLPAGNGVSQQSLEDARLQARPQVTSEDEGRIRYELLDPERDQAGALLANRGLQWATEATSGPVSTISIVLSGLGAYDFACPGAKISTRTSNVRRTLNRRLSGLTTLSANARSSSAWPGSIRSMSSCRSVWSCAAVTPPGTVPRSGGEIRPSATCRGHWIGEPSLSDESGRG